MNVAVVGAGVGGLAAAAILSNRGVDVTVFEAASQTGGKIGVSEHEGVQFDTGPSLLTLPGVLEEVFDAAGSSLEARMSLMRLDPEFRYLYPDGSRIDIRESREETLASVVEAAGPGAADELNDFLSYSKKVWEVAGPNYIFSEAPSWGAIIDMGWSAIASLTKIDPLTSMERSIAKRVGDPKIRDIMRRFATYVGSDPRSAPATMNCIAWLEIGRGGFGVDGGMYEVARQLEAVARQNGAEFFLEEPVRRLEISGGRANGLKTDRRVFNADAVVSNVGIHHFRDQLLPEAHRSRAPSPPNEMSMSGWTAVVKAERRSAEKRPAHQVLFPEDYEQEFADIFDRDRPPEVPTVYLCAQEKTHNRTGWDRHEPVFMMANAPPEPPDGPRAPEIWERLSDRMLERAVAADLLSPDDEIVWERTPGDLAERFPGSRGAIYGGASNSAMAAFRRPPNVVKGIDDLYLCGGTVHPGGGVPLCLQSGRLVADKISSP